MKLALLLACFSLVACSPEKGGEEIIERMKSYYLSAGDYEEDGVALLVFEGDPKTGAVKYSFSLDFSDERFLFFWEKDGKKYEIYATDGIGRANFPYSEDELEGKAVDLLYMASGVSGGLSNYTPLFVHGDFLMVKNGKGKSYKIVDELCGALVIQFVDFRSRLQRLYIDESDYRLKRAEMINAINKELVERKMIVYGVNKFDAVRSECWSEKQWK